MQTFEEFSKQEHTHRTLPLIDRFYTDILTPIHMFNALKDEALYILESQDTSSDWSNYTFIGLDPYLEIKELNQSFIVNDLIHGTKKNFSNLSDAIDHAVSTTDAYTDDIDLPFKGGAVGAIKYEAVEDLVGIKKRESENSSNYHFILTRTLIAYNHQTEETTIITYGDLNDYKNTQTTYQNLKARIDTLKEKMLAANTLVDLMMTSKVSKNNHLDFKSNYHPETFKSQVKTLKDYIQKGELEQAVLSQKFYTKTSCSAFQLYRVLRKVNPSPYMFYLSFTDEALIGSSPERQLQVVNQNIEIHPIAGTRRRGKDKDEDDRIERDLLQDKKELSEHDMLVELVKDEFKVVAEPDSITVDPYMMIGKFKEVMHIISIVKAKLKSDIKPIDAFFNSFPAGTLTGAPKKRSMEILRTLEPEERGYYGGCILYYGFDHAMDSCITIRTMIFKDGEVNIQAGAGVVSDSTPEGEYQETVNKASALINAINLAEDSFQ